MRSKVIGLFVGAALLACVGGAAAAESTALASFEDFNGGQIDQNKWVLDNDSGYTVGVVDGTLRIFEQTVQGSGGPSDGVASEQAAEVWQADVNPIKLTGGDLPVDSQMAAIYLSPDTARSSPLIAYGFIGGEQAGTADLAYLESGRSPQDWTIIAKGFPLNQWHTLRAVDRSAAGQLDLYLDGYKVASTGISFPDGGPHLVLRTGGWDGLVTDTVEVRYDNVMMAATAPAFAK